MKTNVYTILRKKYPESEYALMSEVSDAAGFSRSRSADYVIMNLWPSRGLSLHGIELKSFRSDWLGELKKPEKAENIFQYCDYFWLLTSDETVAKIEEIPENWGWLCIKGEKIFVKKEAPKLTPKPITRHFLAALLKRACSKSGFIPETQIEDRLKQERQRGRDEVSRDLRIAQDDLKDAKKQMEDFRLASGVDLAGAYRWGNDVEKIGNAVKFIKEGGVEGLRKDLLHLEKTAQEISHRISTGLEILKEEIKQPIEE